MESGIGTGLRTGNWEVRYELGLELLWFVHQWFIRIQNKLELR